MNKITINNEVFNVFGKIVKVINDTIFVNDKQIKTGLSGTVTIKFEGDLAELDATSVIIYGDVKGDVDCTNITCNDVYGDIDATNVKAKNIQGNVDAVSVSTK